MLLPPEDPVLSAIMTEELDQMLLPYLEKEIKNVV